MIKITVGDKTLVIEDGCNVEIAGDEIKVSPGSPAPQPIYVPMWTQPSVPYVPIYPTPISPWQDPMSPTTHPTITWRPNITCRTVSTCGTAIN